MKRSYLSLIIVLSIFLIPTSGLAAKFIIKPELKNQFLGVVGIPPYTDPVLTTYYAANFDSGFFIAAWHAAATESIEDGNLSSVAADQLYQHVGWRGPISNGFKLRTELIYMDFKDILSGFEGDIFRFITEVSHPLTMGTHKLEPYTGIWGHIPSAGDKPERGVHTVLGLRHKMPLANKLTLSQYIELRKDGGAFGLKPTLLFRHGFKLSWKVNKNLIINPVIFLWNTSIPVNEYRSTEHMYGMGITLLF